MQLNLYNYAGDSTLSSARKNLDVEKQNLETDSTSFIQWFHDNQKPANPDKFQAILFAKKP